MTNFIYPPISELKDLFDEIIFSSTKKDVIPTILKLKALSLKMSGIMYDKFSECIIYATEASGRVENKYHYIDCFQDPWFAFQYEYKKQVSEN